MKQNMHWLHNITVCDATWGPTIAALKCWKRTWHSCTSIGTSFSLPFVHGQWSGTSGSCPGSTTASECWRASCCYHSLQTSGAPSKDQSWTTEVKLGSNRHGVRPMEIIRWAVTLFSIVRFVPSVVTSARFSKLLLFFLKLFLFNFIPFFFLSWDHRRKKNLPLKQSVAPFDGWCTDAAVRDRGPSIPLLTVPASYTTWRWSQPLSLIHFQPCKQFGSKGSDDSAKLNIRPISTTSAVVTYLCQCIPTKTWSFKKRYMAKKSKTIF